MAIRERPDARRYPVPEAVAGFFVLRAFHTQLDVQSVRFRIGLKG
jgi:hypothetical protein